MPSSVKGALVALTWELCRCQDSDDSSTDEQSSWSRAVILCLCVVGVSMLLSVGVLCMAAREEDSKTTTALYQKEEERIKSVYEQAAIGRPTGDLGGKSEGAKPEGAMSSSDKGVSPGTLVKLPWLPESHPPLE